jgi:hypothetical protein
VVLAKEYYSWFGVLLSIPIVLGTVVLFAVFPESMAPQCMDVYLEVPIFVLIISAVVPGIYAVRLYRGIRLVGWDRQGVSFEILLLAVIIGSQLVVVYLVFIFDPSDLYLSKRFNWLMLLGFPLFTFDFIAFFIQGWKAYQADLVFRRMIGKTPEWLITVDEDPRLKAEFVTFCAKQYVSESLLFVEDVRAFKTQYVLF